MSKTNSYSVSRKMNRKCCDSTELSWVMYVDANGQILTSEWSFKHKY